MLSIIITLALVLHLGGATSPKEYQDYRHGRSAPLVQVRNGTYLGYTAQEYGTENFLGMPYALPPVNDFRFRVPQSLNTSWSELKHATEYGPECFGYGRDTWSQGNIVSEDCLTLNVIRPTGLHHGAKLPVVVWIHGGGLVMGGSADRRHNQTFIVQQSVESGMPIVAVSINYRLSAWGFLYGKEIQDSGNTMLGFRDQRLALHWYKRRSALQGDLGQHAPRRLASQVWANQSVPLYSYRFNVQVNGLPCLEVAFVFYNTEGLGYAQNGNPDPLGGVERPRYVQLAKQMVRMWISLVNFGDPNRQLGGAYEQWPDYNTAA